ncbi:MAG: FecR domain-containing protein [Mariniphaga sp.]
MIENSESHWEKIAKKLHGELDNNELSVFERMMNDPVYAREFEKTQQIHRHLTGIKSIFPINSKKSWRKIEQGIKNEQSLRINAVLKYAAIVFVAFIAGNLLKPLITADVEKEIRYSEIKVPYGQMSQITLSDGTKIWMNSGTILRYPEQFAANNRTITIDGEAYFEVTQMDYSPFTVKTADMKVQVLGTSFNLSAYKDDASTSVTLVEGKVAIQNNSGNIIVQLVPGQMGTKNRNVSTVAIQNVETSSYKAWTEGKIYFDDESLDKIAAKLDRWYNVEISFANQKLKSHRFTGTILRNKPVDQIMQALELLSPITFTHKINTTGKDEITIYKKT